MAAFNVALVILQGETYDETVTWKAGDPSLPVDLTGCTARMQIRNIITSTEVLLDLTTDNGGIVLGGVEGTIQRIISATETSAIAWKVGVYDLEIYYPDGRVKRFMEGSVTVSPEVTRG